MDVTHKLRNIAILPFLEQVKRYDTGYGFLDYPVDDGTIREAAEGGGAEDRRLLWMCRPTGAWCGREWDVFLPGTRQHAAWLAPGEAGTRTLAFAVEVTGMAGSQPRGNVIDLDYEEHCQRVRECSRPNEPGGFAVLLAQERAERERHAVPCKRADLLTLLRNRWVDTEARRIAAELREMEPNYGECFDVTVSRAFVQLAKQRDVDRLCSLLPYESKCFCPELYQDGDLAGKTKDVHMIVGPEDDRDVEIISEF